MPYKLLLPPLKLGDRTIYEEGAIVELLEEDAKILTFLGVVEEVEGGNPPAPSKEQEEAPAVLQLPPPEEQEETTLLINLNQATEEQLMRLPGITKAIAQKIIKARPHETLIEAKVASGLKESAWADVEAAGVTL